MTTGFYHFVLLTAFTLRRTDQEASLPDANARPDAKCNADSCVVVKTAPTKSLRYATGVHECISQKIRNRNGNRTLFLAFRCVVSY